jgi:hypothetical protein
VVYKVEESLLRPAGGIVPLADELVESGDVCCTHRLPLLCFNYRLLKEKSKLNTAAWMDSIVSPRFFCTEDKEG